MNTRSAASLATLAFAFAAAAVLAAPAAAQTDPAPPTGPGSAYADPEGFPRREVLRDVEPIYRGPSLDTLATIRKRGTLRVGIAASEPMVMHDSKGMPVGYSVDLARQLATDLGVGVELVETSWSQIIPDLLDRQFDVIVSGLWVTTARALVINFSAPTSHEGIYLVASRAAAEKLKTREDFDRPEVKLVVYAGTVQEGTARRLFPRATLVLVEGDADPMAAVLEGKAHAVLVPTFAPRAVVQSAPDKLFLPLPEPLQSTVSAMGVRKGDADFLNFLDSWLTVYRDNAWLEDRAPFWADPGNWPK